MAKDKKKTDKTAETAPDETITGAAEERKAQANETAEADGSVTLTKEEFEQAQAEIGRMKKEIETLKKSAETSLGDAQRIQAEFSNFRKRNASIRADSIEDGVRETIKGLLPVIDNFERALLNSDGSPFAKGIEQIYRQLIECLKKSGLEEAEASGQFDPSLHEAVMQDDESDCESGTITAVLQKGYRVKGKMIRFPMVKVKS